MSNLIGIPYLYKPQQSRKKSDYPAFLEGLIVGVIVGAILTALVLLVGL